MAAIIPNPLCLGPVAPLAVALEAIVVAQHQETGSEMAVRAEKMTLDEEVLLHLPHLIENEIVIVTEKGREIVKGNERIVVDMIVMHPLPRITAIEDTGLLHRQEDVMMTSDEKQALQEVEESNA